MTIYIPLLYICMNLKCGFFQSENYTLDEKNCTEEIADKKKQYTGGGVTVEGICVDVNIKFRKEKYDTHSSLPPHDPCF